MQFKATFPSWKHRIQIPGQSTSERALRAANSAPAMTNSKRNSSAQLTCWEFKALLHSLTCWGVQLIPAKIHTRKIMKNSNAKIQAPQCPQANCQSQQAPQIWERSFRPAFFTFRSLEMKKGAIQIDEWSGFNNIEKMILGPDHPDTVPCRQSPSSDYFSPSQHLLLHTLFYLTSILSYQLPAVCTIIDDCEYSSILAQREINGILLGIFFSR